jgi:integrase
MASIKQRGNKWQVRIHRDNQTKSRTFTLRTDAERWGREQDIYFDRQGSGLIPDAAAPKPPPPTLGELITRYRTEVTPGKRGANQEAYKLNALLRHPLAERPAEQIRSTDLARYRDHRSQTMAGNTVKNELNLISAIFNHAATEWGHELKNPAKGLKRPADSAKSVRILDEKDTDLLCATAVLLKKPGLGALITLATETGARLSELLSIQRTNVDLYRSFIRLTNTKNGEPRHLPLTERALRAVEELLAQSNGDKLFTRPASHYKWAFKELARRCGFEWATFHGLRHYSVTRMLDAGLGVTEVAAISGHKTLAMLKRYTHHSPNHLQKQVAEKLKIVLAN